MTGKLKTIGAALFAAVMCVSLVGCSQNATSDSGKIESNKTDSNKSNTSSQSSTESKPESEKTADNNSAPETPSSVSNEITITATDEILNAKFDSGLIQCFNDVFRCGGYISATEFIEKYQSLYDFRIYHNAEPVSEETLSEKVEPSLQEGGLVLGSNRTLRGKPKFTVKGYEEVPELIVELINPTDNPIPFSECYVDYVWISSFKCCIRTGGVQDIVTDAAEYLRSLGYEEVTSPITNQRGELEASMENNKKFFKDKDDNYRFYDVGEPTPFGAKPFYTSMITSGGRVDVLSDVYYISE